MVVDYNILGNTTYGSLPRSICNSKGRPGTLLDKNNVESISENGNSFNKNNRILIYND